MKIFGFVKKVFFVGLTILSGLANVESNLNEQSRVLNKTTSYYR